MDTEKKVGETNNMFSRSMVSSEVSTVTVTMDREKKGETNYMFSRNMVSS